MNHMKFESPDMTAQNIDRIAALFPNCVTEMLDEEHSTPEKKVYKRAVNFELLKQMLSPDVVDGDEAYEFTWVGKKAAIVEANKPIRKTLRPCVAESKDWDNTENLYIEGDNLEVLKLLQESHLGKVKMIYIDPPYNTGNDFIYADDFMRSQEEENERMGMYDEDENRLFKNTDTNGRFHSDWCSMIYSRLMLARNLLTDDGVIFISIDDGEVSNLSELCNEIFGEANFIADLIWQKKFSRANDATYFSTMHDHIFNVLDEHYDTDIFTEPTIKGKLGTNAMKAQRHLYDHIVYDSTNERDFATDLDTNTDVAVYVKLPDSFYIATPVGHYNPDWAIAFYEGSVKHIYFVAETKGTLDSMHFNHITPVEQAKIDCARVHFKAISDGNVVYDVVDSYQTLLEKVMK